MQPIDSTLAEHLNLSVPQGIVVTEVIPDSPAEKAGFQVGDIVLSVNGKAIANDRNLKGIVERLQVGKSYPVRIRRNDREMELRISVAVRPDEVTALPLQKDSPATSDEISEFNELGLTAQNVTADLAEQLGIAASGVVITSVRPDSGADRAGLEPGMLISRVGNTNVANVDDLERAAGKVAGLDKILLLVRIATANGSALSRFVSIPLDRDQ